MDFPHLIGAHKWWLTIEIALCEETKQCWGREVPCCSLINWRINICGGGCGEAHFPPPDNRIPCFSYRLAKRRVNLSFLAWNGGILFATFYLTIYEDFIMATGGKENNSQPNPQKME